MRRGVEQIALRRGKFLVGVFAVAKREPGNAVLVRVALDDGVALRILDTEARIRQRLAGGNVQLCKLQFAGNGLVFQISEFDYDVVSSDLHLENLVR